MSREKSENSTACLNGGICVKSILDIRHATPTVPLFHRNFARILHIYAASTTLYVWKVKLRQCHAHRILVSECVCTYYLTHESSSWAWWRHFSWSIRIFLRYHYTCAKSNTVWTFFWVNFVYLWLQHTSWSYFVDHYADWLISWDDLIYWLLNQNAMFSL